MAFRATSTIRQYVTTSQHAIFNQVDINRGDAYDALSGKFTTPIDGLYLFYLSLRLSSSNVYVDTYVDSRMKFRTRDDDIFPTSTFMLHLNEGQTVYIKFSSSITVYGGGSYKYYTWFGGHLIKQM